MALVQAMVSGLDGALARVRERFDAQLASDIPAVAALCAHVERYRGKMLRPTLALLASRAVDSEPGSTREGRGTKLNGEFAGDAITVAAVCEMLHMATLVHDDVLDESATRRQGGTVNRLHGNEAAVILGDYLFSSAFHLCSGLADQSIALRVGRISMEMCAGELLQLHHRGNWSLDEDTYEAILRGKTGGLIALSARLGAQSVVGVGRKELGAQGENCEPALEALERFGMEVGVAFQVQDDLLDLLGDPNRMGKPVGQDLAKGKLTLPVIHHLRTAGAMERGGTLEVLARCVNSDRGDIAGTLRALRPRLESTGSVAYARAWAGQRVESARGWLARLPVSPARQALDAMANAVLVRDA